MKCNIEVGGNLLKKTFLPKICIYYLVIDFVVGDFFLFKISSLTGYHLPIVDSFYDTFHNYAKLCLNEFENYYFV